MGCQGQGLPDSNSQPLVNLLAIDLLDDLQNETFCDLLLTGQSKARGNFFFTQAAHFRLGGRKPRSSFHDFNLAPAAPPLSPAIGGNRKPCGKEHIQKGCIFIGGESFFLPQDLNQRAHKFPSLFCLSIWKTQSDGREDDDMRKTMPFSDGSRFARLRPFFEQAVQD